MMSSSSDSRLTAIEQKRAKLEELRRQRLQRKEQQQTSRIPIDQNAVDDLVKELINSKEEPPTQKQRSASYISVGVETDDFDDRKPVEPATAKAVENEKVTYDKNMQTKDNDDEQLINKQKDIIRKELEDQIRQEILDKQSQEQAKKLEPSRSPLKSSNKVNITSKFDLDESKLAEFVGKSLKIVDKSIHYDYFFDNDENNMDNRLLVRKDEPLQFIESLYHDSANKRPITSFDWSPFGALLAVSYSQLPHQQQDINRGLLIVWNLKTRKPEYLFTSSTEILVVKFALHKKTTIFAGGYNGKILQYDMTSDTRFPVAQSPLSARLDTHSHPIYSMMQINTSFQSAGTLVSCSTDGKICQWSPFLLDKPTAEPLQLTTSISKYDEGIITSMVKLSNGSLLLGGSSLTLLENSQTKFKNFTETFDSKLITGLAYYKNNELILCSSVESIELYSERGEFIQKFSSSSIIMDIAWINEKTFIAATGQSIQLFDMKKSSSFAIFEAPTNEYINKIGYIDDGTILAGTENGNLLIYKYVV